METQINTIYQIDCIEGLKKVPDNFVDSIVTDPPYGLGFMNKSWDQTGIAFNVNLWKECLRVLKPGGYLLAFGGTRTYHRMVCAIEDTGFQVRDMIVWIYSQGFPKGLDISKAIDKYLGAEREVIGIDEYRAKRIPHGRNKNNEGWNYGVDKRSGEDFKITAPATPEAECWKGWGTALKPAHEPICMARKPLNAKNVAENVLKWGTGGLNIDGCRIPTSDKLGGGVNTTGSALTQEGWDRPWMHNKESLKEYIRRKKEKVEEAERLGRYPANIILDRKAADLLDKQSGILKSGTNCVRRKEGRFLEHDGLGKPGDVQTTYGDSGGASRFFKIIDCEEDLINFFYCAKANKKERGKFNNHPTVKPLKLIEYLIKLVTPPSGTCLDPFEGSGTHALACIRLGINYIGFEIDPDYYQIIQKRINEANATLATKDSL